MLEESNENILPIEEKIKQEIDNEILEDRNKKNILEGKNTSSIDKLLDIELDVVVRFGSTRMNISEIIKITSGSIIELDRTIDEPVDLLVNGYPFARGQVVVINGYYGIKITEVISPTNARA